MEIKKIDINRISNLEYQLTVPCKNYDYAVSLLIKKYQQFVFPTLCYIEEEGAFFALNYQRELELMKKYGVTEIQFHSLGVLTIEEFKLIRLTLSNINSEFDPIAISESIRDLTRNHGVRNLSGKIGIDVELSQSYEVLLDFDWGFKSKKEKKIIKDPDQLGIGWDDL